MAMPTGSSVQPRIRMADRRYVSPACLRIEGEPTTPTDRLARRTNCSSRRGRADRSPSSAAASACPSPAVAERLQRLERDGVITRLPARRRPARARLLAERDHPHPPRARASCARSPTSRRDTPEVVECHRITGDDCYVMKAHVRDVEHLEEVIDRFVALRPDDDLDRAVLAGAGPRARPSPRPRGGRAPPARASPVARRRRRAAPRGRAARPAPSSRTRPAPRSPPAA